MRREEKGEGGLCQCFLRFLHKRTSEGRKEEGRLEGFGGGAMLALCLLTYIGPLKSALFSQAAFSLLTFLSFSHLFPSVFIFSSTLLESQLKHKQDNESTEASAGRDLVLLSFPAHRSAF